MRRVLGEVGWLLGGSWRLVTHWPRLVIGAVGAAVVLVGIGRAVLLLVPGLVIVGLVVWRRVGARSFEDAVGGPFRRARLVIRLRRRWPQIMIRAGLSETTKARQAPWDKSPARSETHGPVVRRPRWEAGQLVAEVVPLVGQTTTEIQAAAEAIRYGVGATLAQVRGIGATGTELRLTFGDPLAEPFPFAPADGACDLAALPMGRTETGAAWLLRLGPHTLVAGRSGSGKASLVWGITLALGPAIHAGLVEVHGIDLKGGMELSMGAALFTRYARTGPEAVVLLEDAAQALQERARRLAGTTRQHHASTHEPHVLVLIDELAALTAYLGDRDLTRRANTALAIVCSQGRAVGYTVFGCLQDPRKETIPVRGLFTQMIGLRLADREETAMVLGEGAVAAGAACHCIPAAMPGIGYVIPETGGPPVRVRGALIRDQDIRNAAATFPTPTHRPVAVLSGLDDRSAPSARPSRPRRPRTERAADVDGGAAA